MEIRNKIVAVTVGAVTSLAAVAGFAAFAGAQSPAASAGTGLQTQSAPADVTAPDTATDETNEDSENEADEGPENEAEEAAENAALADQASLSAAEAEQAAISAVPGIADPAELENENGTVVYEVHVTDDAGMIHEIKVDANSGEILKQEAEDEDQEDEADEGTENEDSENEADEGPENEAEEAAENAALADQASLSAAEAEQAAISAVPGTADPAELENENGTVVYEVAVTDDAGMIHEIKVDANTGEVLAEEADNEDDNEDDEGPENQADEGPESVEGPETPANEAAGN